MCTNANYKFKDHSFTKNIEYYNTIEKTSKIIEATKAIDKTTNYGTNYKKS